MNPLYVGRLSFSRLAIQQQRIALLKDLLQYLLYLSCSVARSRVKSIREEESIYIFVFCMTNFL